MPCTHRIEIAWSGEEREGDGGGLIPFAWMFLSEGKGFKGFGGVRYPFKLLIFKSSNLGEFQRGGVPLIYTHTHIYIYIYKIIYLFFYR